MKKTVGIFLAQALSHLVWYMDIRAAMTGNKIIPITLDLCYTCLTVFVLKNVLSEDASKKNWIAMLLGGAFGTYLGISLPVIISKTN